MNRVEIFRKITSERTYQDGKWGTEFDDKNTVNDWVAYLVKYVGQCVTLPWNKETFHEQVLKVATLCVAILERDHYPPRHYDGK